MFNRPLFARLLACAVLIAQLNMQPASAREPIDFPLITLSGEEQSLADYRGRWVIVNYWATWCPPCREEIPELDMFHVNHRDKDAVVLGINFEDISKQELAEFIDEELIGYPIFHQRPQRQTPFGALSGLPTTFVVTPEGIPVAVQSGGITAERLERFISNYQAQTTNPIAAAEKPPAADRTGAQASANANSTDASTRGEQQQ